MEDKFNEALLKEIVQIQKIADIVGMSSALSRGLEELRYVRNSVNGMSYEQGLEEEKEYALLH